MKKKTLIMTAVVFVLLLAVIAAGLNAVFTVTYVKATFHTFSAQGEQDAHDLQKELDKFIGKSTTFLHLSEVSGVVEKNPYFRVERIEKKFPRTVELTVSERKECFAVRKDDGTYAVLDEEGVYLSDKGDNVSRTGGGNIELYGFALGGYTLGKQVTGTYLNALIDTCGTFSDALGVVQANVKSIRLFKGVESDVTLHLFRIKTQEGVTIDIYNPLHETRAKAEKAVNKYMEPDGDYKRLYGTILVTDDANLTTEWTQS